MNELIVINNNSEYPTVSGRDLHAALGVVTDYPHWFARMCDYGFIEGKSYRTKLSDRSDGLPGKPLTDHEITIGMAKELCMLQRSDKGKLFREYFIQCEESWNSPEKIMERALEIAHRRAIEAEKRIFGLIEEKESLEIALNESLKYYTVMKYNTKFHCGWDAEKCKQMGKRMSAYCRSRAIEIRKCYANDGRFDSVNSYPITAWEDYLGEVA